MMQTLYDVIQGLDPNKRNILAKGCEGVMAGESILFSDGGIVYPQQGEAALLKYREEILGVRKSGKICVEDGSLFCEVLGSEKKLVICGAGHVSMPVIAIGKMIGFFVTVLEDRPSFADCARRAGADRVICDSFEKGLDEIEGDRDTFFVIVTRGHRFDMVCLERILQKKNAYIGMIGSRARVKKVLSCVEEALVNSPAFESRERLKQAVEAVYAPVGLAIGAETPEEIGVSIMGQIIEVKNRVREGTGFSKDLLKGILSLEKQGMGRVLATIVDRKGSAPRGVGTKMIFFEDGSSVGTIGGGCAEAEARRRSLLLMHDNRTELYRVDMTGREAAEDGMVCGGRIEVLLEPILPAGDQSLA